LIELHRCHGQSNSAGYRVDGGTERGQSGYISSGQPNYPSSAALQVGKTRKDAVLRERAEFSDGPELDGGFPRLHGLKKGGMRQAAEASNTTPAADGAVQVECHAQIAPWAVKRARIFS